MSFKVNREIISSDEVIYDGFQEQAIEFDCILPDYCPDIFKVLKCIITPCIVSKNISENKIGYELVVKANILYQSENSNAVNCIEQKMVFSKSVDVGEELSGAEIRLIPVVDYVNCRAVNQRRLDIRGAISVKITVTGERAEEVISDSYGMNIQLKKEDVSVVGKKLIKEKQISVSDDIDIGYGKPPIKSIIRSDCIVSSVDKKIIANKVIVNGEMRICFLYCSDEENGNVLEKMEFTLPFSQIMDVDGVDDSYDTTVSANILGCELSSKQNSDGEMKTVSVETDICLTAVAVRNNSIRIVSDAYSTTYPCECVKSECSVRTSPEKCCEIHIERITVKTDDNNISSVYDAWSKVKNSSVITDTENGTINLAIKLANSVVACDNSGKNVVLENEHTLEHKFRCKDITDKTTVIPDVDVISVTYNIDDNGNIELKCEVRICINIRRIYKFDAVTEIKIDDTCEKKQEDYALKMYFADEGETLWDIAKKYSTSIEAIMEENDCPENCGKILLIPIVS